VGGVKSDLESLREVLKCYDDIEKRKKEIDKLKEQRAEFLEKNDLRQKVAEGRPLIPSKQDFSFYPKLKRIYIAFAVVSTVAAILLVLYSVFNVGEESMATGIVVPLGGLTLALIIIVWPRIIAYGVLGLIVPLIFFWALLCVEGEILLFICLLVYLLFLIGGVIFIRVKLSRDYKKICDEYEVRKKQYDEDVKEADYYYKTVVEPLEKEISSAISSLEERNYSDSMWAYGTCQHIVGFYDKEYDYDFVAKLVACIERGEATTAKKAYDIVMKERFLNIENKYGSNK